MQVYLTDKEVTALIETATEWYSIMGDGDEHSCEQAEERMDNGLGSALYKLYKGRYGQRNYEDYARKYARKRE